MAEKLTAKILFLCQVALIVGLAATIGCVCLYRHYQERLKDRSFLESYVDKIESTYEGESLRLLDSCSDCYCVFIAKDGSKRMYHNNISQEHTESYLLSIIDLIADSGALKGQQSGFLYFELYVSEGRFIACRSLEPSYHTLFRTFAYAFSFGCVLILITYFVLRFWIRETVDPIIAAGRAQIQFFSDVGHELKTPLAIISANTEVLELTTGENQWTRTILGQVERMTELVQNMLMLTRLETQDASSNREDYPLGTRLVEELEAFQVMAELKGIQYETEIDESITFYGNPVLLDQLVIELLNNAVKYTDENGVIAAKLKRKNNQILLSLWNTHDPLPKEELNKLFERFYRVDSSRSQGIGGFGIGLAAVKSIAEKHNAAIRSFNQENGICFEVNFPANENN